MRILSLELENFRKFDRPHRVAGFGPGLNVLAGPNEHGKSTLLAAIGAALFEKHDSKAGPIRSFQTRGHETAPRVAVSFAVGGIEATVEKRFLQRPEARLTFASGIRHEGDAAETRLRDLLGFDRQGQKVDLGLWSALWVPQGLSFDQADLSGERACQTIGACLEAELGTLTGTGRGDAALAAAEASLGALRDMRGRPRGRPRQLAEQVASLDAEIAMLDGRVARVAEEADELARIGGERARVRARLDDRAAEIAIADARTAREAALNRAARIDAVRAAHVFATERSGRAARAVEARAEARRDVARTEGEADAAAERSLLAARRSDAVAARMRAAEAVLATARTVRREAATAARDAAAALGAGEAQAVFASREALLARALDSEEDERRAAARAGRHLVSQAALASLRDEDAKASAARAAVDATATIVVVSPDIGAPAATLRGIDGVGRPLDTTDPIMIHDEAELFIAGFGRIRIRAAGDRDRDAGRRRADAADASLRTRLATLGVETLAAAVDALRLREADEAALAAARATLARLVPGDDVAGLAPGVAPLAALVETLRLRLPAPGPVPLSRDALAEAVVRTQALESEAVEALALADARIEPVGRERDRAAGEAIEARIAAEHALRAAAERRLALDAASAAAPDALLAATAAAERDAAEVAERALDGLEAGRTRGALETEGPRDAQGSERPRDARGAENADAPDADALLLRINRLVEARENDRHEAARLGERIATLRTRIEEACGAGLAERREEAIRARDAFAAELAALDRDAASLALLATVLRDAVGETRTAAVAPLARRIEPHLARLLPGSRIRYGEDYGVRAITRRDGADEPFGELSHGTREQIAILARLALADILHESGRPAALVLDDALVFSDGDRIERMFDALADAATRIQVLVLTCRADVFSRLGGTRLFLEPVPAP